MRGSLRFRGPISRSAIAARVGLTQATVSRITRELIDAGLVEEGDTIADGRLLRGPEFNAGLIESFAVPDESTGELRAVDHVAGGLAVVAEVQGKPSANGGPATSRLVEIMRDAAGGDGPSRAALHRAGRALAFAVTSIHAILHPEVILLCGPLIESESYCSGVRQRIVELAGAAFLNQRLRFSHLSNQEAACSLAIFRALVEDDVSSPPAAVRGATS